MQLVDQPVKIAATLYLGVSVENEAAQGMYVLVLAHIATLFL